MVGTALARGLTFLGPRAWNPLFFFCFPLFFCHGGRVHTPPRRSGCPQGHHHGPAGRDHSAVGVGTHLRRPCPVAENPHCVPPETEIRREFGEDRARDRATRASPRRRGNRHRGSGHRTRSRRTGWRRSRSLSPAPTRQTTRVGSEIFARQGVEIPRSTLIDWCGQAVAVLRPLVALIGSSPCRRYPDPGPRSSPASDRQAAWRQGRTDLDLSARSPAMGRGRSAGCRLLVLYRSQRDQSPDPSGELLGHSPGGCIRRLQGTLQARCDRCRARP